MTRYERQLDDALFCKRDENTKHTQADAKNAKADSCSLHDGFKRDGVPTVIENGQHNLLAATDSK
jgi:hypothetical protein